MCQVASVKYKKESLANPQIRLYNASTFADCDLSSWQTDSDPKIKCVDCSIAGVWAIKSDLSVLYREGTGHENTGPGSGWTTIGGGKMRFLSVGEQAVWAVNPADEVFVRVGLSPTDTKGKEWTKIDGAMKVVAVGPTGVCWAVDKTDIVWRRLGAKSSNPIGSKWQSVTGKLSHISVGQAGVWGVSPKNEVMYRDQTYGLPGDAEGAGWTKVDGLLTWLSVSQNIVWGVSSNGQCWYRAGIDQNCPMGTNWYQLSTDRVWRMVASYNGYLWGVETSDLATCKTGADITDIIPGNSVTLSDEYGQFKSFSIQEKPSSFQVLHGGWVIYEKPNFKGKCLYNYEGDCYSNDPENKKGPKLKSWQEPIGSVRFLRGVNCPTITARLEVDWAAVETQHSTSVLSTTEERNNSFDWVSPTWTRVSQVEGRVAHQLELDEAVAGLAGVSFTLEGVPKQGFGFTQSGNKMETGTDFRQELGGMFTWHTDSQTGRQRTKLESVKFPATVAPKTLVKVFVVIHSGTVRMPFTATFTSGNKTWSVPGVYTGVDATNIKLEFEETSLLEGTRKISRI